MIGTAPAKHARNRSASRRITFIQTKTQLHNNDLKNYTRWLTVDMTSRLLFNNITFNILNLKLQASRR